MQNFSPDRDTPAPVLAAYKAYVAAGNAVSAFKSALKAQRKAEFLEAGGCKDCDGYGLYMTWGTMDSMSGCYDTFAPCKTCGGETIRWCGSNDGALQAHPHREVPPLVQTEAEKAQLDGLEEDEELAEMMLTTAIRQWAMVRGAQVEVVRGRKVPQGTKGEVVWAGHAEGYGYRASPVFRVGIKDAAGQVHYTAATNVQVRVPSPFAELPQYLEGSEKQVAWAMNIRKDALASGALTFEQAKTIGAARWYIDHRDDLAGKGRQAAEARVREEVRRVA